MPRSVNHVASRAKRKRILKLTRGYYGARKNVWTVAKNTWEKGLTYAFRDRRNKKRNFRALWIQRINAGEDNKKHRPVMIHRAPFGSMERFVAVLIEHTGGKFPLWLTPDQVAILPISEKFNDYAYEVKRQLEAEDLSVLVDDRNEKIGRKIRDTELKRIPYMLIVGEKEAENNEVSVRKQGEGDKGSMKITTFAALLKGEVEDQMNHWKKDNN